MSAADLVLAAVAAACDALAAGDRPATLVAAELGPILDDRGPPSGICVDLAAAGLSAAQVLRSPVGDEPSVVELAVADVTVLHVDAFESRFGATSADPPLGPGEPRSRSVVDTTHPGWVLSLVIELRGTGIGRISIRRDRPAQDPGPTTPVRPLH